MNDKNNTQAAVSQALLGANDKGRVTYQVNGEDINLSFQIVRNFLTRGNAAVSDAEVIQFISLCKANKLNPFIGEAWLVKYDAHTPAQMLTARDAFMKRAEDNPKYEGYRSGVILQRDKEVVIKEGAFYLPTDTLVGGWAEVHRSDRKFPIVQRVRLVEYTTGKSTWAKMPGTMIQKVAEAHAFRKAFPMVMSGLYTPEEMPEVQAQQEQQQGQANAAIAQFTEAEPAAVDAPAPEAVADPEPPEFTPDPEPEPVPVQGTQEIPKVEIHYADGKHPWDKDDDNFELFNV